MRLMFGMMLVAAALLATPARAQTTPRIITDNPGAYATAMLDAMTLSGMRPMRERFQEMLTTDGGALPANVETSLLVYERAIGQTAARVSRIVEDVTLADTLRSIYLYHYYGDNNWVFTRLDFHNIGDGRWALTALSFADKWSGIVLTTTPGFRPSAPTARR